jgi:hypothetical protein
MHAVRKNPVDVTSVEMARLTHFVVLKKSYTSRK